MKPRLAALAQGAGCRDLVGAGNDTCQQAVLVLSAQVLGQRLQRLRRARELSARAIWGPRRQQRQCQAAVGTVIAQMPGREGYTVFGLPMALGQLRQAA